MNNYKTANNFRSETDKCVFQFKVIYIAVGL